MWSVGLIVEKDERLGWHRTTLGPELRDFVFTLNVKDEAFAVFRVPEPERSKQPTKMKKWACACTIVRCATKLPWVGICPECGEPWEWPEKEPNPWAEQQAPDKSFGLNGEDKGEELVELRSSVKNEKRAPKKAQSKPRKKDKQKKEQKVSQRRESLKIAEEKREKFDQLPDRGCH